MTATLTETAAAPAPGRPPRPTLRGLVWVTWRQHRTAMLGILAALGVCALVLLYYGLTMHSDFKKFGLPDCLPGHAGQHCGSKIQAFAGDQSHVNQLMIAFLPLPLAFGLFLGAPLLAREYESGSYRFAFTQGASRTRWLTSKIVLLSAFTIAAATVFTFVVQWWYGPLVALNGRLGGNVANEIYGPVFVGRALFALAFGIFAGALLRRVVPAIAAALVGWIAVVVPSITTLRPHLMAPLTATGGASPPAKAWVISDRWTAPNGRVLTPMDVDDLRGNAVQSGHKLDYVQYLAQQGYHHIATYQPANRFWAFQSIEAGGLAVLSAAFLVAAVWLVRRRAA
jgi:hypothetical protein